VAAAPSPARAASVGIYCYDVFNLDRDRIERKCIEVPLLIDRERCCRPPFHLVFEVDLRDAADRRQYVEAVTERRAAHAR
jgi:hypothetical protein